MNASAVKFLEEQLGGDVLLLLLGLIVAPIALMSFCKSRLDAHHRKLSRRAQAGLSIAVRLPFGAEARYRFWGRQFNAKYYPQLVQFSFFQEKVPEAPVWSVKGWSLHQGYWRRRLAKEQETYADQLERKRRENAVR